MKACAVVLVIATLSGCATYSDLRERPADFMGDTAKTPQAYLSCVEPKWVNFNAGAHIITDGSGLVLVVPVGGGTPTATMMTLAATPGASETHVEMKHMPSLSDFSKQWQAAKSCL